MPAFPVLVVAVLTLAARTAAFDASQDIGNVYEPRDDVSESLYELPTGFWIGAASAAFQIEGAWNESGKGPSNWDVYLHNHPELDNADVACDSYHKYTEDVTLAKNAMLMAYRFSISWPRVLPDGTIGNINQAGLDYYSDLIDLLLENNIEPLVTMFHWDLPQTLQDQGGWANSSIQDVFVDYANLLFKTYGDRVKWWITFNEPSHFCGEYEGSELGSGNDEPGVTVYQCAKNVILSHAKTYQLYYQDYPLQGGQVGLTTDAAYSMPLRAGNADDEEAADQAMIFQYGLYADPIVFGDFPDVVKTTIAAKSKAEGRTSSRLPEFTDDEKTVLKGTYDFLGVNHYSTNYATFTNQSNDCNSLTATTVSSSTDSGVTTSSNSTWKLGSHWSTATPWGLRGLLNWIKDRYQNLPVIITENGYNGSEEEGLQDFNRIAFLSTYYRATLRAVNEDNCNVLGHMEWSLLDNLEWQNGYTMRFGLHWVDFTDPNRKRTPKKSVNFVKNTIRTRKATYQGFDQSS